MKKVKILIACLLVSFVFTNCYFFLNSEKKSISINNMVAERTNVQNEFDNDGIRYVQEGARVPYVGYTGLACGDAIRLTKCYDEGGESLCEYDRVKPKNENTWKSKTGLVYRNKLNSSSNVNCPNSNDDSNNNSNNNSSNNNSHNNSNNNKVDLTNLYTAYFHENGNINGYGLECGKTMYYADGVCYSKTDKDGILYTPDVSKLKSKEGNLKFIGWVADDDGKNINCSGRLVTAKAIDLNKNTHYYACYEQKSEEVQSSKEPVDLTNLYTAYFHESGDVVGYGLECGKTSYYSNGVCYAKTNNKGVINTPNTNKLTIMNSSEKFKGWAADDDGKNINCSGNLITSSTMTLKANAHYYACFESSIKKKCENTKKITNGKGEYQVNVCYNAVKSNGNITVKPVSDNYNKILTCANGYIIDDVSKTNVIQNTCTKEGTCYKTYKLNCVSKSRPTIKATSADVTASGYGDIKFTGVSNVGISGYYASSYYQKPTDSSAWVYDSRGTYSIPSTPGSVFLWVKDEEGSISYAAMASVIDRVNPDTTVNNLEVKTSDGTKLNTETYAYSGYVDEGITSSDYVRLSNKVKDDSKILASGFNPFDTAYKVTTSSDKIAVYATLTSNDASYVEGYEPRTVNLEYGINTILIKIKSKKGKERTYTIIVTREDDRNSTNLLKSLSVSEGSINFDPYKTDYVVSVGKNKTSVNINAELASSSASYINGYGPRKIELTGDSTKAEVKVKSQTGSVRAYNITFIKSGETVTNDSDALLSTLSLSKAYIAFDKKTYEYNTSVDYEIDAIDIYALAENGGDSVTLYKTINGEAQVIESNNISLNVGPNNITIVVVNQDGKTRSYSINIMRKENGLDISSDTKLNMLSVDGYDIKFDPNKDYYEVKIKREKTLVIAATPANNRADIYITGNDNLTAFSTVRVKVVAEDGQFSEYIIDIKKDKFNKTIETIGLISGLIIIICGIIVIRVKKNKKSVNDYYAE